MSEVVTGVIQNVEQDSSNARAPRKVSLYLAEQDFTKTMRVWPYVNKDSEEETLELEAAKAAKASGATVTVTFEKRKNNQGRDQNFITLIEGWTQGGSGAANGAAPAAQTPAPSTPQNPVSGAESHGEPRTEQTFVPTPEVTFVPTPEVASLLPVLAGAVQDLAETVKEFQRLVAGAPTPQGSTFEGGF